MTDCLADGTLKKLAKVLEGELESFKRAKQEEITTTYLKDDYAVSFLFSRV